MRNTITITIQGDEGDDLVVDLPARYEVCGRCDGAGKHVNPSIDGNGITSSEWAEWDEDERDSYMNGAYDVTCEECGGLRVVKVADEEALSAEQLKLLASWNDQENERHRCDAEDRRYRRMEAWAAGERD